MQDNFTDRWNYITLTLASWRKCHRGYAPQIVIWQKNFAKMRLESEKHLCEYRRSRRPSHIEKSEKILIQAEQEFKSLSRLEFLASLS